jgi:hypothetical protein
MKNPEILRRPWFRSGGGVVTLASVLPPELRKKALEVFGGIQSPGTSGAMAHSRSRAEQRSRT